MKKIKLIITILCCITNDFYAVKGDPALPVSLPAHSLTSAHSLLVPSTPTPSLLETLPPEVLWHVLKVLSLQDFVSISRSNKALRAKVKVYLKYKMTDEQRIRLNKSFARSVEINDIITAKYLLEIGANINLPGRMRNTPLHLAVLSDDIDIVKLLLAKGALANSKNNFDVTPIRIAANIGNIEIARILLQWGADPSIADKLGQKPLDFARSEEMRKLLQAEEAGKKKKR